jgi:hypothetical protein
VQPVSSSDQPPAFEMAEQQVGLITKGLDVTGLVEDIRGSEMQGWKSFSPSATIFG